ALVWCARVPMPGVILEPCRELSKLHIGAYGTLWRIWHSNGHMPTDTKSFAIARWAALVWVLTWFPLYTWFWGWQNMLHLCDVSVVIACLGLWFRQSLLVSSQALLAPSVASTQHELCVPGSFATPRVGAGSVAPDGYPGGMHSHFLLANSCRVSACFSGSARSGTCN